MNLFRQLQTNSDLGIIKIDKKDLISWGQKILKEEMAQGIASLCHHILKRKMLVNCRK